MLNYRLGYRSLDLPVAHEQAAGILVLKDLPGRNMIESSDVHDLPPAVARFQAVGDFEGVACHGGVITLGRLWFYPLTTPRSSLTSRP